MDRQVYSIADMHRRFRRQIDSHRYIATLAGKDTCATALPGRTARARGARYTYGRATALNGLDNSLRCVYRVHN